MTTQFFPSDAIETNALADRLSCDSNPSASGWWPGPIHALTTGRPRQCTNSLPSLTSHWAGAGCRVQGWRRI